MPYADNQWQISATGQLPGGERWVNTWGVQATDVGADVNNAIAQFAGFYADISSQGLSTTWNLDQIKARNLVTEVVTEFNLSPVTSGTGINGPLPNQLAVRISLKANPNINGGPFLAGWDQGVLDAAGELAAATQTALVDAVDDLVVNLAANDFELVLIRPSVTDVAELSSGRIGTRFDVIRKRANEQIESYALLSV